MADAITTAAEPTFREQADQAEQADQEAPAEQPQETEALAPETEAKPEKLVPLQALHQARASEKEARRQARESQQNFERLQAQQVEMMRYMQQAQQPQMPAKADDPIGYTAAGVEHLAQKMQNWEQKQAEERYQAQQAQQFEHFRGKVGHAEAVFAQQNPDYQEAINWAKNRKIAEYVAAGMPEEYATQRLQAEVMQLAQMAFDNNESPAEAAYRMAKAIGYRNRGVSAEQKLEMQKQGQAATMPGGGGVSGGRVSLEALSKLSGKEFIEATSGDNWRKLMSKQ
jgi:hypothetical protein